MKIYYKVVTRRLQSATVHGTSLNTQYKINEWVQSPFPQTPLCVFSTLKSAKSFAGNAYRIFRCQIRKRCPKPWIPYNSSEIPIILKRIVNKKKYVTGYYVDLRLPYNTVCAKEVKLLEEVA